MAFQPCNATLVYKSHLYCAKRDRDEPWNARTGQKRPGTQTNKLTMLNMHTQGKTCTVDALTYLYSEPQITPQVSTEKVGETSPYIALSKFQSSVTCYSNFLKLVGYWLPKSDGKDIAM